MLVDGCFLLKEMGSGIAVTVLVWHFRNGVGGSVGVSRLLQFGVLRAYVVVLCLFC